MGHQCHVMSGWPKGFKGATAQHDSFGWVQGHEESPNVSWLMEFQHIYIIEHLPKYFGRMWKDVRLLHLPEHVS